MCSKDTYIARRAKLKWTEGSGLLLFLGDDELDYPIDTCHFRLDSTFRYFFGLPCIGLSAIIDIDDDKEILFGDELIYDGWMGALPTLKEKSEIAGITEVRPSKEIECYLAAARQKHQQIHSLPPNVLINNGGYSFVSSSSVDSIKKRHLWRRWWISWRIENGKGWK